MILMYTVDRIEKEYIVLENRKTLEMINVEKEMLPNNIKEQDIVNFINNKYIIDKELTNSTKKNIKDKFNKLKN